MRRTRTLIAVATALMQEPSGKHWGYELSGQADVRSGVMYPLLRRLLEEGWLEDGWEEATKLGGRPPRRYYTLTELGVIKLGALAVRGSVPDPTKPIGFREGFAR